MPPRKTANKRNDVVESSAAAGKRRRVQFLNPPPATADVAAAANDLNFSPPSPMSSFDEHINEVTAEEQIMSSFIQQQSFIVNYHVNAMLQNVEQFWRSKIFEELKKTKEIETKLKSQEQQADLFRSMYYHYEHRSFRLEETLRRSLEREQRVNIGLNEEVQSGLVDPKTIAKKMDMKCRSCERRPANMISLPCMHLSVCLMCERRVKVCPICGVQKSECFLINPPLL